MTSHTTFMRRAVGDNKLNTPPPGPLHRAATLQLNAISGSAIMISFPFSFMTKPGPPHARIIGVGAIASEAGSDNAFDNGPAEPGTIVPPGSSPAFPPVVETSFNGAKPSANGSSANAEQPTAAKNGPYSVGGLSPLETFVPEELMPGELIVHHPVSQRRDLPPLHPKETERYRRVVSFVAGLD